MVSLTTPPSQLGATARRRSTFPAPTARATPSNRCAAPNGTVVMFICNHCPYVKAVIDRIVRDMAELRPHGVGQHRDHEQRPGGLRGGLVREHEGVRRAHRFTFPYVIDDTQDVARAYGAVCTPDFFGFDNDLKLAYRGRLDASGRRRIRRPRASCSTR